MPYLRRALGVTLVLALVTTSLVQAASPSAVAAEPGAPGEIRATEAYVADSLASWYPVPEMTLGRATFTPATFEPGDQVTVTVVNEFPLQSCVGGFWSHTFYTGTTFVGIYWGGAGYVASSPHLGGDGFGSYEYDGSVEWLSPQHRSINSSQPERYLAPGTFSATFTAPTDPTSLPRAVMRSSIMQPDGYHCTPDEVTHDPVIGLGGWVTPAPVEEADLDVALRRVTEGEEEAGDVELGEEFDVELAVSAPATNPITITDATAIELLDLPPTLELVSGSFDDGFDLAPGERRSATFTLRAVAVDADVITSSWTAVGDDAQILGATAELAVTTVGTFDGDWFRTDPVSEGAKEGEEAPVRLRVENETGLDLVDVELVEATVVGTGDTPGEAVLTPSTTPHEGSDQVLHLPDVLAATGGSSFGFEDFTLQGVTEGDVVLRALVRGTDPDGATVEGTIEEEWVVRATDLTIEIAFDPPEKVQEESDEPEAPPEPVEMTATVTMTNTSGGKLSKVTVEEFEVTRAIGEQQLWLEQIGGQRLTNWAAAGILLKVPPTGTDEPLKPFDLEDEEVKTFTADFIARDDGQLDFHVLALAADEADRTVRGYGEASWVVSPEKYLEITTQVVEPDAGKLLKAGEDVIVTGRIVNLSQTAELEVGPLLPVPEGNTGLMSLAYGGDPAPDPALLTPIPTLTLGPGDSELFELAVSTNYSDPRIRFEDGEPVSQPSGGTRAYLEFDPWAVAIEADGTERTVRTDPQTSEDRGVKLAGKHAKLTVSIDDTIPIPETDHVLLAGAITAGTLIGVKNAAVGLLYGVVETVKLPYTILRGSYEYQSQVWDSFTEEERALFAEETSFLVVSILKRNVELGLQDGEALLEQVNQTVYEKMTDLATEWETGDYLTTAEVYAAGAGEVIGSVALPVAMARLAQTPRAVAALTRAQQAVNARMLPILDRARGIQYVDDALPLLRALENGAELTADQMRALAGITPEELGELQRLANQYDVLLTFRSRHQSSIEWMKKFGAMMKPEAIKIKSVSELDVKLGYRDGDLGSVVFKKPEPLRRLPDDASGEAVEQATRAFVQERGFSPGTAEYDDAVKRMVKRIEEWDEYGAQYRTANRRKWLETEFNYDGNAIPGQQANKFPKDRTGFELEETGRGDEWVVKLQDPKDGRFKRVTGDIDPIAFTNLDGSPLTGEQHKALMDAMRESAILRAQHPESATFKYGADIKGTQQKFILSQFKPGEPGFQIGPNGPARVVRLDPDQSKWINPRDYNLHWEGGYVHVGGRQKIAPAPDVRPDFNRDTTKTVSDKIKPKPFVLGEAGETTFGRATIEGVATGTGTAVFVGEAGELVEVLPDGSTRPYAGGPALLEEGEPVTIHIAPAGEVESTVTSTVQGAALSDGGFLRQQFSVAATAPLVDGVVLLDDGSPVLFAPGQVVAVGVQDGQGELRTIASVTGRELRFTEPVAAAAEDIVVMVQPAPGASGGGGSVGTVTGPGTPEGPQSLDPACPATMPAPAFTDLGATHARAVGCATHWSLVEGYDATTFGTGDTLTRGQIFTILARLLAHLDVDLPAALPDAFADDDGTTHEPAADLLASLGLAGGFADGTVGLGTHVTRGQVAALLARIAGLAGDELPDGLGRFGDLDASVHRDAIERLAAAGIVAGYDETRFGPTDRLTRGQTASVVMRYLARLVELERASLPDR